MRLQYKGIYAKVGSFNKNGRTTYTDSVVQYLSHLPRESVLSVRLGPELNFMSHRHDLVVNLLLLWGKLEFYFVLPHPNIFLTYFYPKHN